MPLILAGTVKLNNLTYTKKIKWKKKIEAATSKAADEYLPKRRFDRSERLKKTGI